MNSPQMIESGSATGRRLGVLLLFATLLLQSSLAQAVLRWHWEDGFSADEQEKLEHWLNSTHAAVERYVGPFPFDVHVHMHRRDDAREPVPWANTWRSGRQALYFYVDASYPLKDFLDDWTAAHEFSHLILPYLGRDNMWFAEGFASYLQHSVMVEMGMLQPAEAQRRRGKKMQAAQKALAPMRMPLPEATPALRKQGKYPTIYWGGAVYFERVDAALQAQDSSLQGVLQGFLKCCRLQRRSLKDLAEQLDEIGETAVFSSELSRMQATAGVPSRPTGGVTPDGNARRPQSSDHTVTRPD